MHPTALINAKLFFDNYSEYFVSEGNSATIVEIGSQDVNGSIRLISPPKFKYVGVDFVAGRGVDIVLEDPYKFPFLDSSANIVVTSSCMEHSEFFWVLFLEMLRILTADGLLYINAPSNGEFHRWPVDCWRFYPDAANALVKWAKYNKINSELLESFTTPQNGDQWNDFVAIILKDARHIDKHTRRITSSLNSFSNGFSSEHGTDLLNYSKDPEDRKRLKAASGMASIGIPKAT